MGPGDPLARWASYSSHGSYCRIVVEALLRSAASGGLILGFPRLRLGHPRLLTLAPTVPWALVYGMPTTIGYLAEMRFVYRIPCTRLCFTLVHVDAYAHGAIRR